MIEACLKDQLYRFVVEYVNDEVEKVLTGTCNGRAVSTLFHGTTLQVLQGDCKRLAPVSEEITRAAQAHNEEMCRTGYFDLFTQFNLLGLYQHRQEPASHIMHL